MGLWWMSRAENNLSLLGNVISPQKIWDSLGADILRLWVASTDFRSEMVATDEILETSCGSIQKNQKYFQIYDG